MLGNNFAWPLTSTYATPLPTFVARSLTTRTAVTASASSGFAAPSLNSRTSSSSCDRRFKIKMRLNHFRRVCGRILRKSAGRLCLYSRCCRTVRGFEHKSSHQLCVTPAARHRWQRLPPTIGFRCRAPGRTLNHPLAAMQAPHLRVEVQVADEDASSPSVLDRRGVGSGPAAHRTVHPQVQAFHLWDVKSAVILTEHRADVVRLQAGSTFPSTCCRIAWERRVGRYSTELASKTPLQAHSCLPGNPPPACCAPGLCLPQPHRKRRCMHESCRASPRWRR